MRTKSRFKIKQEMQRYVSRMTKKYQATIPKVIRDHLHLESGDEITYELLADNTVVVRKTTPLDINYLRALESTMNEWESDEDERSYKNLLTEADYDSNIPYTKTTQIAPTPCHQRPCARNRTQPQRPCPTNLHQRH